MSVRILPLLMLAVTGAAAAPRASVELLPQSRVADGQVMLGDVARLQSDDLELMRRLVNLPVGQAPQPGQSALVHREALAGWVHRTTGLAASSFVWSGANTTHVLRSTRHLRGEEIADAAVEGVRTWMRTHDQHGDLRVRTWPHDVEVAQGPVRLLPRTNESGGALRNRLLVWVDLWVAERFIRSVPVTVEIAGLWPSPAGVTPVAGGLAVAGAGAPVNDPAVTRGEWAALRTESGAVSLESRVEVLQDGRIGQRVRVRVSSNAGGILFARVVAPGQLELAP